MKKYVAMLGLFLMVAVFVSAHDHAAMAAESSWTGEVIDVACYSSHGAKGAGHVECGTKCVKGGLPVGLLVGDTTYLLVSADHKALNDKLADLVGKNITVTGEKFESKGANLITVKDFKPAASK